MNCEQALGLISARLDRELAADDAHALDQHLGECATCRATAEAFALQDRELRQAFEARRAAAAAVARTVATQLPAPARRPTRRWLRVAVLGAAVLAACVAGVLLLRPFFGPVPPLPKPGPDSFAGLGTLVPMKLADPAKAKEAAVGATIKTGPAERTRVALPDKSILYVDRDTLAVVKSPRRVRVERGNVYVEVKPDAAERFVIETPTRQVEAHGTRFEVQVANQGTGVVVTQGKVKVSNLDDFLVAGQQVLPGQEKIEPAPRTSYLLDWTRDLMEQASAALVPPSQHAGGTLIAHDSSGQEAKLSLRKYSIDVHIEDGFARTTIDQTYFNHHPWRLEGTFNFPLPADASLSQLTMYVDGKRQEGGMVERQQGRAIYNKIVNSQRDPALLEWVDGTTFKMRVFPLEGRQEKRILLSYTQRLSSLYGRATYRFPAGHSLQMVRDWSFHARIKDGKNVAVLCPTHPDLVGKVEGGDLLLSAAEHNVKVDRDVVLYLPEGPEHVRGESIEFRHADHEGYRYSMTRFRPELPTTATRQRRDWVFLYEASADRDPLLARVQIEVIRNLLTQAEHDDRFFLVAANSRVHLFEPAGSEATAENIQRGCAWLEKTNLVGALDLGAAFEQVGGILNGLENPYLVHLGSGHPGMGRKHERLKEGLLPAKAKYVGIGVGKRWARTFMKELAEKTGGLFAQINPDEPVAWRTFELLATLNTPRLLGVKAEFEGKDMPRVLVDQAMLAQGEELCITTRVPLKAKLPARLVLTGTLEGQEYRKVIPLEAGPGGADYLPRTWARLEIERLLVDGAMKNKDELIQLSKDSYVMTPFTSLLVLENEAMYKEFKVEQGRKDHWAAFAAPDRIPVVYEPDPTQIGDVANAPRDRKPGRAQILSTIYLHVPAAFLRGERQGQNGQNIVAALQVYNGAFAVPTSGGETRLGRRSGAREEDEKLVDKALKETEFGLEPALEPPVLFAGIAPMSNTSVSLSADRPPSDVAFTPDGTRLVNGEGFRPRNAPRQLLSDLDGIDDYRTPILAPLRESAPSNSNDWGFKALGFYPPAMAMVVSGRSRIHTWAEQPVRLAGLDLDGTSPLNRPFGSEVNDFARLAEVPEEGRPLALLGGDTGGRNVHFRDAALGDLAGLQGERSRGALNYQRLVATGDRRLRDDLLSYAPGLNTSPADIRAVLEAEGEPELRNVPGHIDPEALALINAARQGGWMRFESAGQSGTLLFDASGRFVATRQLPIGLREETVCDGDTLLSLYPELGLAGQRTVSRYHRAEVAAGLPHVVLPAADLARGHDLLVVGKDKRTVAIVPTDVGAGPYYCQHLVFAADGKLAERQVVLMPEGKIVRRQILLADGLLVLGLVKEKDKEVEKELAWVTFNLTPVAAPSLARDLTPLVVLEFPLRNRNVLYERFKLDPNQNLDDGANGGYRHLPHQDAVQLLAHLALTHHSDVSRVWHDCFLLRDDLRPGLLALLAAGGSNVGNEEWYSRFEQAHPESSLVRYFGVLHNPVYADLRTTWPIDLTRGVGPEGSFLQRLARFHELFDRWENRNDPLTWTVTRGTHLKDALAFLDRAPESILARTLLVKMQAHGRLPAGDWERLAGAWAKLNRPGYRYRSQYEEAACLRNAGDEAGSRTVFLKVANEAVDAGVLPPLDGRFYEAVSVPGPDDPWTKWVETTADKLIKKRQRRAVLDLASRVRDLGDPALSENLIVRVLAKIADDRERQFVTAAVVDRLLEWNLPDMAAAHLKVLLADPKVLEYAGVNRLAARVAQARGQTAIQFAYHEKALELEARNLPEVIDLTTWRQDYRPLLDYYLERARVLADLGQQADGKSRADLIRRTVRTVDTFRAHDPEAGGECLKAGQILRLLGAEELAWDYLTTPYAGKEDPPALHGDAANLSRAGAVDLAERMYRVACEADPHSVDLWWDRAQALQQAGHTPEATALFQELADGTVSAQDKVYRERARWWLKQH